MAAPAVVAFCPSPPLLVPAVGVGPDEALDALRARCHEAVSALLKVQPGVVVVLGASGSAADENASGSFAPWGVDLRVGGPSQHPTLSLPHAVGAWLLDEAGWQGRRQYVVPGGTPSAESAEDVWALLVIADGSATRTPKAPGSFDPDGERFDETVVAALTSGDPSALAALEAPQSVHAQGVPAWHEAARLTAGTTYETVLLADVAPFGVGYFVAVWTA